MTRTLVLTIALPDYYAEDITQAEADEWYEGDLAELALESMHLITPTVRILLATGDKGGNDLHEVRGVVLSVTARDREQGDDDPEDERLSEMIEDGRR